MRHSGVNSLRTDPRSPFPLFSVLRDADFRTIWYVGSLHAFARRIELLVLSWLVLQVTDSYFQLGLVLVFNNVPRPLISLFSGLIISLPSCFLRLGLLGDSARNRVGIMSGLPLRVQR